MQEFEQLLSRYNQCFYQRDLEALRALYVPDSEVLYFDNHVGGDSQDLETHLTHVANFFRTGNIVPLISTDLRVFPHGEAACMVVMLRYRNKPAPGVRASFFLEKHDGEWKIRHIHFSADPNETSTARSPTG